MHNASYIWLCLKALIVLLVKGSPGWCKSYFVGAFCSFDCIVYNIEKELYILVSTGAVCGAYCLCKYGCKFFMLPEDEDECSFSHFHVASRFTCDCKCLVIAL